MRRLKEYIKIDETSKTGLRWIKDIKHSRIKAGQEAFTTIDPNGSYIGSFQGKRYRAHRVVVYLRDGVSNDNKLVVNHIDGNPLNNSSSNLELISHQRNSNHSNRKMQSNNTSGYRGISYYEKPDIYRVDYRGKYIGRYKTIEEAKKALNKVRSNDIDYL